MLMWKCFHNMDLGLINRRCIQGLRPSCVRVLFPGDDFEPSPRIRFMSQEASFKIGLGPGLGFGNIDAQPGKKPCPSVEPLT